MKFEMRLEIKRRRNVFLSTRRYEISIEKDAI